MTDFIDWESLDRTIGKLTKVDHENIKEMFCKELKEENKRLKEENEHLKNKVEGLKYRLKHAYDLCYCFDPGNQPWSSLDPQDNPGDHT